MITCHKLTREIFLRTTIRGEKTKRCRVSRRASSSSQDAHVRTTPDATLFFSLSVVTRGIRRRAFLSFFTRHTYRPLRSSLLFRRCITSAAHGSLLYRTFHGTKRRTMCMHIYTRTSSTRGDFSRMLSTRATPACGTRAFRVT